MCAVFAKWQVNAGNDGAHRQVAIKMRKKRAAARGLPPERIAECACIDSGKNKVLLTGKVFLRRGTHLIRGREMNEPVSEIDRRSGVDARILCRAHAARGEIL